MTSKEGYDVLRLIGHNKSCYVSSEYVRGIPLIRWLKYHPVIPKEQLFTWINEIADQIAQIHKCSGNPCYQYVNPYSIIVAEDHRLYFLDLNTPSNEEQIRKMQRRTVREYFLPPEENYYRKASVKLDIYGLGRTIQYVLSVTEPEPGLKKREVIRFQKIISKCIQNHSKKTFQNVSDIQKYIPKYQRNKEKKTLPIKKILAVTAALIAILFAIWQGFTGKQEKKEHSVADQEMIPLSKTGKSKEENSLNMELGFLYFLEIRDYEKSQNYFQAAGDTGAAQELAVIAGAVKGDSISEEKLRQALKEAEEKMPEDEKETYYECILRGYTCLNSTRDREHVIRIGQACLDLKSPEAAEILGWMAEAYEKNGEIQKAAETYEKTLEATEEDSQKEELYLKLTSLLEHAGEAARAQEKAMEGIRALPESVKLRIQCIRIQCRDTAIDRALCVQTIETYLRELPELESDEEFQKLMKEYGWKTEGAKVWEEK